ncbi:hypothetical protein SDRG_01841 [Saprolegnia diclina VS20]|uniref:Uncharacterized protein n=1 Tax=Saprolegnia diclina (strain VS20) TaxID=1156394 RepID=T0R342_SAPDV|nr:hypothetical protein SDRG_01841 [Saprolegnia diclina VS20]EQC40770.1 hypothetical protein SDRG_01841 [Saprolegnia diclina VS20]|eukprot:XP_008605614.1 hypothetical protein SDRG_01841 [Saprolegnia diclina VS20]
MDLRLLLNPCVGLLDHDRRSSDLHRPEPRQASTVNLLDDKTCKRRREADFCTVFPKRPRTDHVVTTTRHHYSTFSTVAPGCSGPYRSQAPTRNIDNASFRPHLTQMGSANSTCNGLYQSHADLRSAFLDVGFNANSIFNQICPLRKGRWRKEEEAYAIELVKMVHANRLPLKFRQSLRTFLAQKLHSDEMRVLKKVGNSDAFAFARQRGHADEVAVTRTTYENERSIEPLETLRRAFLKSVQIEVVIALREYDGQALLDSPTMGDD